MAQDFSFDVASEVDLNLVQESIQVALKEISTRFDFRDSQASFELLAKEKKLVVRAKDPNRIDAALDVLFTRMAKRGLPLKNFQKGKAIEALGQTARMEVTVQSGIPTDKAKEICSAIKQAKLKVNPTIQGDQVRVASKSKDDLQSAIALIKAGNFGVDLQFKNYR